MTRSIEAIVESLGGNEKKVREALNRLLLNPREVEQIADRMGSTMNRLSCRDPYMDLEKLTAYHILLATGAIAVTKTLTHLPHIEEATHIGGGGTHVASKVSYNDDVLEQLRQLTASIVAGA